MNKQCTPAHLSCRWYTHQACIKVKTKARDKGKGRIRAKTKDTIKGNRDKDRARTNRIKDMVRVNKEEEGDLLVVGEVVEAWVVVP